MFCPKCGLQNADQTKFCRGCGVELGGVLAVVDGRVAKPVRASNDLLERSIALKSRGVYGVLASGGFLAIAWMTMVWGEKLWFLLPLAFAFVFMAAAVSRFVQASGLRKLAQQNGPAELTAGRADYLADNTGPPRSVYETDDLIPASVTERTTNLLTKDAAKDH